MVGEGGPLGSHKAQQGGHDGDKCASRVAPLDYYLLIADSAQTEYCTTFHCPSVCPFVTGVTSHISHIYKGINAMLIIREPIKPCIF